MVSRITIRFVHLLLVPLHFYSEMFVLLTLLYYPLDFLKSLQEKKEYLLAMLVSIFVNIKAFDFLFINP